MISLAITAVMYIRYSNECYLQANIVQQQFISYGTTLVSRIKSVDGYKDEYPIAIIYIDDDIKEDKSLTAMNEFSNIRLDPFYSLNANLNKYAWMDFISLWCGYKPAIVEAEEYINKNKLAELECYPDDGSIEIINNIICIRFD